MNIVAIHLSGQPFETRFELAMNFAPPEDFSGEESAQFGDDDFCRRLTPEELEASSPGRRAIGTKAAATGIVASPV